MLNKTTAMIVLVGCLVNSNAFSMPDEKISVLKRVNSITEKLLIIAQERHELSQKGVNNFDDSSIELLIQKENNLDVLSHLAAVVWANSNPGRFEDHVVDDVMNNTWTMCIGRIEKIGGDAAIRILQSIPNEYPIDGGASETLNDALEHLKSKKHSKAGSFKDKK